MLNFIGIGSAFNSDLGNTSAFIKRNDSLLLIDCGGAVFGKLQRLQLLRDLKHLYVIITHTHPDHVGSLGELIFYCHYILGCKPTVIFPEVELITGLLEAMGVRREMYDMKGKKNIGFCDENFMGLKVSLIPTSHTDTIPAFGILLQIDDVTIYYSGDSNKMPEDILMYLQDGQIDRVYQDTCGAEYEGNPHLPLRKLAETVKPELRNKVYCMHLDPSFPKEQAIEWGFNVVEVYTNEGNQRA